jgi:hypothetical protein
MVRATQINIKIESFQKLTGCELDHFTAHAMRGDAWGTFMKLAAVVEASAKRAVALKLGTDPSSDAVMRMEFYNALLLCHEAKLISEQAFSFGNYVRHVRNDLAHTGGSLDLDVERLRGSKFFNKYRDAIAAFVTLEGQKITDGIREHLNALFLGCVTFVSQLAESLLGERWVVPSAAESTEQGNAAQPAVAADGASPALNGSVVGQTSQVLP